MQSKKNINPLPDHLSDVQLLSHHFQSVSPQLNAAAINDALALYRGNHRNIDNRLQLQTVSDEVVLRVLNGMKGTSVGRDGISLWILKLCNFCISESVFPGPWKEAIIRPVPKVRQPLTFNDVRPISLLPVMSKVLEKIIDQQLKEHLSSNNLLPCVQSSFRAGYSCATALLKVTDDVMRATDSGRVTVLVLLDFSKAFDTVHHDLLLAILHYMGLDESAISFFQSYLAGRTQVVEVSGKVSAATPLDVGLGQGTILAPTLFSIYTASLQSELRHCSSHFYADDTQLYFSFLPGDVNEGIQRINDDLRRLVNFTKTHNLVLNPTKSKVLLFGGGSHVNRIDALVKVGRYR